MTFSIHFTPAALRDLGKLPRPLQVRIIEALEAARGDPTRVFRRLKGSKASRMRVGDHRVVADIEVAKRRIIIYQVAHRKNVYD